MELNDFKAVMADISQANKDHGIDFRGKSYLEVSKRVEIFRKHFGISAGILTRIEHLGTAQGEPVVVQAQIISDNSRIIATGTACEVIGQGNVNRASALENAETSAIGRALATLGLHGGEFASLNEMAAIGTKPENLSSEALKDAWEDAILDQLPDDPSAETLADAYAERMAKDVEGYKTARGVEGYMKKHEKHLLFMSEHAPEAYSELRSSAWARMQELNKGKAA